MIKFTIALAGRRIGVSALYESTLHFCSEYICDGEVDFSINVSRDDIEFEHKKSAREDMLEGIPTRHFSDAYLETLAVYRKIAEHMLEYNTFLFHGSVVAVDGEGYLFTAKSGTGKSTHTSFWRKEFGNRAVMINDDKPLIQIRNGKALVWGTPWDGKHRLSTNTSVPLKGICILERGAENCIEPISPKDALPMLLQQSYRPQSPAGIASLLSLLDKLTEASPFYRLKCNLDPSAARVAYNGMHELTLL